MKYQHYSRFGSSYFEIVLHDLHLSVKPSELTEMPGRPGGFCSEVWTQGQPRIRVRTRRRWPSACVAEETALSRQAVRGTAAWTRPHLPRWTRPSVLAFRSRRSPLTTETLWISAQCSEHNFRYESIKGTLYAKENSLFDPKKITF